MIFIESFVLGWMFYSYIFGIRCQRKILSFFVLLEEHYFET